jgi:hypothetical protein
VMMTQRGVRLRHGNDGLNRNPHGSLNEHPNHRQGRWCRSSWQARNSTVSESAQGPQGVIVLERFRSVSSHTDEMEDSMASFLTFVLYHGELKDAETMAAGLLAPYNKAREVAEYEGPCPCVHAEVEAKAGELAKARVQTVDSPAGGSEAERNQLAFDRVCKYARDLTDAQRVAIQELLYKATPDPNCKDCGGSGTIKTTANPNGKWTEWEIGCSLSPNMLAEYLTDVPEDFNIVPVKLVNLAEAPMPVVIITPDGKWHTAGDPDWFGTTRIDDRDWDNTARKILQHHTDAILVVVECQT